MTKARPSSPRPPAPPISQESALADALADCVAYLRARMEQTRIARRE